MSDTTTLATIFGAALGIALGVSLGVTLGNTIAGVLLSLGFAGLWALVFRQAVIRYTKTNRDEDSAS